MNQTARGACASGSRHCFGRRFSPVFALFGCRALGLRASEFRVYWGSY